MPIALCKRYYLGVDPGISGGAALLDHRGSPALPGQPLRALRFEGITEHEISNWFIWVREFTEGNPLTAVIEKVHSMPKQGVASSFKFGVSYGFLRGILTARLIPFEDVPPQTWQKALGCLSRGDKNVTKAKAHQLWPAYSHQITHKVADALLLAEWLRLKSHNLLPNFKK